MTGGISRLRAWGRRRVGLTVVGALVAVGLTATAVQAVAAATSPDFTITAAPATATTAAGGAALYSATLTSKNGFDADVSMSVADLPADATGTFTPSLPHLASGGTQAVQLSVATATTTPLGTYTLTLIGSGGGKAHTVRVKVTVKAPADYSLTVSPTLGSVTAGAASTFTAKVKPLNGFTGTVTFAPMSLPAGLTATIVPQSVTFSSVDDPARSAFVTVSTTLGTVPNTYHLQLTGTSGALSHTAAFDLAVAAPKVTVSLDPATATVAQTDSARYGVTITRRAGTTGRVTLGVDGLPSGIGVSFSQNPIPAGATTATLTLTPSATTAAGSYPFTVTTSLGGVPQGITTGTLIVVTGGKPFTISGNLTGYLYPGTSRPLDLTLTNPNGVPINVTLLSVAIAGIDPQHSACDVATNFEVEQFSGDYSRLVVTDSLALSAVIDAAQLPQIEMKETGVNQDVCQGATLSFTYGGSANGGNS